MPVMLSSELVRNVLDSAPDAMIIIDSEGSIIFANQQVTTLFGYTSDEIAGQAVEQLMPERFRRRHVAHRHHYVANVRLRPMGIGLDLFARRKDGTEFPVEISLSPVREGENTLIAAAIRDVTDRMRADQELKEAHAAADRANLAKSRFLATASHDLRQPLQTLGLLSGALRRMVAGPQVIEALDQHDQAVNAMSRLLNTLLDISKLESGAIKPEIADFKVAALFDDLRNEFASLASSKGLAFKVEPCAASVHSDPALIGQVLRNLVANAIKYTQRGFVEVRGQPDAGSIRIDVRDSGVGIAADHLRHIYDEFYQVGVSANTSRDGYGLGLSIVQRIAKLLDIGVDVVSELGQGSSFSIVLPAGTADIVAPTRSALKTHVTTDMSAAKGHIMLVEDDPGVRNATRMLLKVAGFRVTTAASRTEALQCADKARDIDLVVTDYHLGDGETGLEVITAVRSHLGADIKSILVTGDTSSAMRELQQDAHLRLTSKPIDADDLLGLIGELLASK